MPDKFHHLPTEPPPSFSSTGHLMQVDHHESSKSKDSFILQPHTIGNKTRHYFASLRVDSLSNELLIVQIVVCLEKGRKGALSYHQHPFRKHNQSITFKGIKSFVHIFEFLNVPNNKGSCESLGLSFKNRIPFSKCFLPLAEITHLYLNQPIHLLHFLVSQHAIVIESELFLVVVDQFHIKESILIGFDLWHHFLIGYEIMFASLGQIMLRLKVVCSSGLEVLDQNVKVRHKDIAELDETLLVGECFLHEFPELPIHATEKTDEINEELLASIFAEV